MMWFSKLASKLRGMILSFGRRASNQLPLRVRPCALYARVLLTFLAFGATTANAWQRVVLEPSKDNTLYETPIDQNETQFERSNGAGSFLFSGRTGLDAGFRLRRALLRFDLETSLPPGAQIFAVELTLYQSNVAPDAPPAIMGLHRVLQEWGEAGSDGIGPEGQGDFPEPGDATWHHRIFPDTLWDTAGGHFAAVPSAVTTIGQGIEDFTWACSAGLLSDMQFWQQNPAENFGWIVVGGEEGGFSAHRFNSRENADEELRPRLAVYFTRAETIYESGFEAPFSCPE